MEVYEAEEAAGSICPRCGFAYGTPPKEVYHLFPGELLHEERYVVGTVVAYGGFGIIYRAWDRQLEIMVAIKEFFPAKTVNRNPGTREVFAYSPEKEKELQAGIMGFLGEARNTAKFADQENIVKVYDYFRENNTAYMVMEFMSGVSLKQYIKGKGGRISWEEAVNAGSRVMDILKIVHADGIIHRDIAPDNIYITQDGKIKLFDFGAARFADVDTEKSRAVILKIGYAPPEQYRSKSIQGPFTDIYALGATLYRAITGVLPVESVNRAEAVKRGEPDPLKHPKELAPEIPEYLDIAIMKSMALEPELRFKNCEQFKDAVLNQKRYVDVEQEIKRKKFFRKAGITLLMGLLAAGFAGCFLYYRDQRRNARLEGADLTAWYASSSEESKDLLKQMSEEFQRDYPGVRLSCEAIPAEQYGERLKAAAESGTLPDLFESTGADSSLLQAAKPLDAVYSAMAPDETLLSAEYLSAAPDNPRRLPLGFEVPLSFGNMLLSGEEPLAENDADAFLAGESRSAVLRSSAYTAVQEALPGVYTVEEVAGKAAVPVLCFSVSAKTGKLDQLAAERLLGYWCGETAQETLHIAHKDALPVNREELRVFLEVNPELSFLSDYAAGSIRWMSREEFDAFCGEQYKEQAESR